MTARSPSAFRTALLLSTIGLVALAAAGCSDGPAKGEALELLQRDVKEEASCTLPLLVFTSLKMQHMTKGICVPREGSGGFDKAAADKAMACVDALIAVGVTKKMPEGYMAEWPDDLSGAGFDTLSPYERRARHLLYRGCVELTPDLRGGQFRCGTARAEKVLRVTKQDDAHAAVRYARTITLDPRLATVEAACGTLSRPGPEATVTFALGADKKWQPVSEQVSAPDAGLRL